MCEKVLKLSLHQIEQRLRLILNYPIDKTTSLFLMFMYNYGSWNSNLIFALGAHSEEEPDGALSKK